MWSARVTRVSSFVKSNLEMKIKKLIKITLTMAVIITVSQFLGGFIFHTFPFIQISEKNIQRILLLLLSVVFVIRPSMDKSRMGKR